jgi:membrane associated rhomboid family serine protease
MAYGQSYGMGNPFGFRITPMVKRLLIVNGAVFLLAFLFVSLGNGRFVLDFLAFRWSTFFSRPWTLLTYAFTHVAVFHLLFNMLALFFFGPPLEEKWGSQPFLRFYLVGAAGAALFSLFEPRAGVIGASGAVYAVMLAFAMNWPNQPVYIFGIFPVPAKWLVGGMAVLSILYVLGPGPPGISHWAHLGGFITAFAYLKSPWAPNPWGELPSRPGAKKAGTSLLPWVGKKKPVRREAPTPARAHAGGADPKVERELLDDVDRILDKISEQGIGSLTEEERKRLDEVSRKRRTN